jgi:hypothetical protein
MNDQAKADAPGHRRPLQHFEIAVGIAECRDWAAADVLIDANRLAGPVIDEIHLRQTDKLRPAVAHKGASIPERRAPNLDSAKWQRLNWKVYNFPLDSPAVASNDNDRDGEGTRN